MKTSVLVFPGSNCDRDAGEAMRAISGQPAHYVWHQDHDLPAQTGLVIVPGGFSYGDYLRSGAIAARSPIMGALRVFAARGGFVLGICNGFQILTESGLLPGALTRNQKQDFICREVVLRVTDDQTPFSGAYVRNQEIRLPIAHHDGCYVADPDTLDELEGDGRVLFRYADNPNGSARDIAGIMDEKKRILGLMPHPERAVDPQAGRVDGVGLFQSLLQAMGA